MDFDYFMDMTNNEKVFLLIIVMLVLTILLGYLKLKNQKKESKSINKLEVEPLNKVVEKEEEPKQEQVKIDLVLDQMRESLKQPEKDVISSFEDEQEEKSIISYQELVKANQSEKKEMQDEIKEETNSSQSSSDLEKTKFQTSEFISPIYGRINNEIEYPTIPKIRRAKLGEEEKELEKQEEEVIAQLLPKEVKSSLVGPKINIEAEKKESKIKLDQERLKNESFLKSLKEFRKNLE